MNLNKFIRKDIQLNLQEVLRMPWEDCNKRSIQGVLGAVVADWWAKGYKGRPLFDVTPNDKGNTMVVPKNEDAREIIGDRL